MSKKIPLTRGLFALVDDEDFAEISRHKWHALSNGRPGACSRFVAARVITRNRKRCTLLMHRVIASPADGQEVDHRNRDPLDNRRTNLRLASRNQNVWNRASESNHNGFRGVHRHRQKYRAEICAFGSVYRSKSFAYPEDAARAYDQLATLHHGTFAVLNFPTPPQEAAA